ncbi:MAG: efflux RND transporter periplasmic adaptor subunit [Alphaproteobacteria bacterium]|nr:efflux RND transporter periplasmic adaptor subunit [Alphaproteobacteria bacterium]
MSAVSTDRLRRVAAWIASPTGLAIAISVAATAWVLSGQIGASEKPQPRRVLAQFEAQLAPVRVRWQDAEAFRSAIVLSGHSEANRKVDLRIETTGRITAVGADKGTLLGKGDTILRLTPDDREPRLIEARSLLRQRQIEADAARQLQQRGFRPDTQVAAAEAALEAARAQLARIELDMARATLRAPFAGILDRRPAEVGAYLKEGDLVATLVDLDPIVIVVHASERDIGKLRPGLAGEARLMTGETVAGAIRFVAVAADPATRTFRVEFAVPNPDRRLVDGVTAQLRLPTVQIHGHLISPALLSLAEDGAVGVKTVGANDIVVFTVIEIVATVPDGVWVRGLPDRARLITVGQEFVKPGQRVQPVDETAGKGGS